MSSYHPESVVKASQDGFTIFCGCSHALFGAHEIHYELFVRNDNRSARRVKLKAACGPGDDLTPVITVMHPWES